MGITIVNYKLFRCIQLRAFFGLSFPFHVSIFISGPCDILSVSTLNPKSVCQLDAARFLCYCYKNSVAAEGRHGSSHEDAAVFDYKSALLSMLTEEQDLKKAVNVQIVS